MASWTDEEIDYLKNNYNKLDAEKIGKNLNRSANAVRHKAQRLDLSQKKDFWSEEDEIYLEYFAFEKDSNLDVAANFLNRSANAVQLRLSKLRAQRSDYYYNRPWTRKEDNFIRNNYKCMSYYLIAARLNRSYKAVSERVRMLNLKKYTSIQSQDNKIRELAVEGVCPADIAKNLNLKASSVNLYLKKHNIPHRVLTTTESLERANLKSPWHNQKFNYRKLGDS